MRYDELTDLLQRELPQLTDGIEQARRDAEPDSPGPHVVYGDVLVPYLKSCLDAEDRALTLEKIFGLVERLAASESTPIREVVMFSILEGLVNDPKRLARARTWMGKETNQLLLDTKESIRQIEQTQSAALRSRKTPDSTE